MAEDEKGGLARLDRGFEPTIQTTARPSATDLLTARAALRRDEALHEFVRSAREHGLHRDEAIYGLAVRLDWGAQHADALVVAEYLWDEQAQLGDGYYITSTETGKVLAALTADDLYQPAPVPREDGQMGVPMVRIRPEIEAAITCWQFERGRETSLLERLAARANQTVALKEQGDPRLLVATRAGRRHIVSELAKIAPLLLLENASGTAGMFLSYLDIRTLDVEPPTPLHLFEGSAFAESHRNIADVATVNLHHNRAASLQGALVQGWVRDIAKQLAEAAHQHQTPIEVPVEGLTAERLAAPFWIAPPEAMRYLRRKRPEIGIMPVAGAPIIGIRGKVGVLVVPERFEALTRERFDRWEAEGNLNFRLWVDWTQVVSLTLSGITHQAVPV